MKIVVTPELLAEIKLAEAQENAEGVKNYLIRNKRRLDRGKAEILEEVVAANEAELVELRKKTGTI